jgi:phosphoribosylamine--glycine ligase
MKVLVVGGGGREHALAWKLGTSERVGKVFIAPGNAGTSEVGENVAIAATDVHGLKGFALSEGVDLTIVGPELPLTLGIVDEFKDAGLRIFGPRKKAAEIEGSKVFCKDLMVRSKIPTAFYKMFDDPETAGAYIESHDPPFVVKADGLAAGKGVSICSTRAEALEAIGRMMRDKVFGAAGTRVIVEEFLDGEEASILAITDGNEIVPLAPAQDHKAIYDGDHGPNTGGMGAYSPAPLVTPEMEDKIMDTVMEPTVRAMQAEGRSYCGVLYAGLMIKDGEAKVLEFNCRFGDPEIQPILMRLEDDLFELLMAAADTRLEGVKLNWSSKASVCVVLSSRGYPGSYEQGRVIKGLDDLKGLDGVKVFHAGTAMKDGDIVTSGGRVLGVTGLGTDIKDAIERTYKAVEKISWEGAYFRKDIGKKALRNE